MPAESALRRKLRGPLADWDVHAHLLRLIEFDLRGANWQRAHGKSSTRPKPIDLPSDGKRAAGKLSGDEIVQRLRNLGMIQAGATE